MDFWLFLEFPCREGMIEREAFAECWALAMQQHTLCSLPTARPPHASGHAIPGS